MKKKKLFQGKRFLAGVLAAAMAFGLAGTAKEGGEVQAAETSRQVLTVNMKETTGDIL